MNKNYKIGLIAAIVAQLTWGFLPIYWQSLRPIDSKVIIYYRIVTMAIVCFIIGISKFGLKNLFKPLFESKGNCLTFFIAGLIITANWSLYIWAVNANYVIQACMGYYIEPLFICILGIIIFKEKANLLKKISFVGAAIAILIMIIGYKEVPLIAISLASTFSVYAVIKKKVSVHPIQSLLYETIFAFPIAVVLIIHSEINGAGALAVASTPQLFLLSLAGLFTAIPLGLYSLAAGKLPFMTLGISGYLSTSISLILGIFVLKEPFDIIQFSAFLVIWIGLVFFTLGERKDVVMIEGTGKYKNEKTNS